MITTGKKKAIFGAGGSLINLASTALANYNTIVGNNKRIENTAIDNSSFTDAQLDAAQRALDSQTGANASQNGSTAVAATDIASGNPTVPQDNNLPTTPQSSEKTIRMESRRMDSASEAASSNGDGTGAAGNGSATGDGGAVIPPEDVDAAGEQMGITTIGDKQYTDAELDAVAAYLDRQKAKSADEATTYEQWKPYDSQYHDAIAAADKAYRESQSVYGRNAEQLAQAGLTGSGYASHMDATAYAKMADQKNDAQQASYDRWNALLEKRESESEAEMQKQAAANVEYRTIISSGVTDPTDIKEQMIAKGYSEAQYNEAMTVVGQPKDVYADYLARQNQAVQEQQAVAVTEVHNTITPYFNAFLEGTDDIADLTYNLSSNGIQITAAEGEEPIAALDRTIDDLVRQGVLTAEQRSAYTKKRIIQDAGTDNITGLSFKQVVPMLREQVENSGNNHKDGRISDTDNLSLMNSAVSALNISDVEFVDHYEKKNDNTSETYGEDPSRYDETQKIQFEKDESVADGVTFSTTVNGVTHTHKATVDGKATAEINNTLNSLYGEQVNWANPLKNIILFGDTVYMRTQSGQWCEISGCLDAELGTGKKEVNDMLHIIGLKNSFSEDKENKKISLPNR